MFRHVGRLLRRSSVLLSEDAAAAAASESKLSLNFFLPTASICNARSVDRVTVPSLDGVIGISARSAPTVCELKPGVVTIEADGDTDKYFVSGGFCFIKDSVSDINAVEAVLLDDLDEHAVATGLEKSNADLATATSEEDKVIARIGVETYKAMSRALGKEA